MFLFEQMFNQAIAGVAPMMSTIILAAYGILLASLLYSVYEAWAKGGDVRALGIAGVKYLAIGLLLVNDGAVYRSVFQAVVGTFNQLAHSLAGPGDVFRTWLMELRNAVSLPTLLNLVTGTMAGLISAVLLLVAMVVYPVSYGLFTIFYCLFGTILYATGPLVLALMPSFGLGPLAKRYATNVVLFASWGLLYAIFCRLTLAINLHSMAAIVNAGSIMGLMVSASAEVLLAVVSILFSVCILLIPFLAKRVVEGDLGSSMLTVLGAATTLAQAMASAAAGPGDGWSRVSGGAAEAGKDATSSSGGGSAAPTGPSSPSGGGAATPASGSAQSPTGPQGRSMGAYRPPNVAHAIGWLTGASAALAVQGGQKAVQAGRAMISGSSSSAAGAPVNATAPPSNENPVDEWI